MAVIEVDGGVIAKIDGPTSFKMNIGESVGRCGAEVLDYANFGVVAKTYPGEICDNCPLNKNCSASKAN